MGSRIPEPPHGAIKSAVSWAAGLCRPMADAHMGAARLWQGAMLCSLIVVYAARLGLAGIFKLAQKRWAIGVLAVAIPFGAFEYQSHHAWRMAANDLQARGEATSAPAWGTTNESASDNAKLDNWKRSVEEAVKSAESKAQARQKDGAKAEEGGEAPGRTDFRPRAEEAPPPMDLGIVHEVEKQQADALMEANANNASETKVANEAKLTQGAKETGPSPESPEIADHETDSVNGTTVAGPPGRHAEPPSRRVKRHSREKGHGRGSPYRWAFYRLVGVARAFPYVWYLAR